MSKFILTNTNKSLIPTPSSGESVIGIDIATKKIFTVDDGGTITDYGAGGGGGGGLGIFGQDEGIGLGTGTILNVLGTGINLTISGSVLSLTHTEPVDNIGIMALDNGSALGTGTTINFGSNLTIVRSGTVLFLSATGGGGGSGGLGIMVNDEGIPVGTGTTMNFVGNAVSATISGTVVNVAMATGILINPVDYIQFNTSASAPINTGVLYWNDTDKTLGLIGLNGTALQIGQETYFRVVNKTGVLIPNGSAVYISGAQGQRPTITLAKGDATATQRVAGLTTEDIANNAEGFVTVRGVVGNIDTTGGAEAWANGNSLWVSKTTAGALTNVEPPKPHHSSFVGYVINAHATQGKILVDIQRHLSIEEASDTNFGTLSNGDIIRYNLASGTWMNVPLPNLGLQFQDEGVPLGTGYTINVTGQNIVASISGTIINIDHTNPAISFPQDNIGVMGWNQGTPLGTGTVIDFGTNVTATISGTVIRFSVPAAGGGGGVDQIGVFGKNQGTNLGTGTIIDFGLGMNAAITGTTIFVHPFAGGNNGDAWIRNTGSVQGTSWVNQDYNIQFFLGDGNNTVQTGSTTAGYAYVEVPVDSLVESWTVFADATGSIVANVLRSTYSAFPPTSPLAGLGQPLLTSQRKNTGVATGTASLLKGDILLLNISSASTVKNVTLSLQCRKVATQ